MKVLVGVPFHTKVREHADAFLEQWKAAVSQPSSHDIVWEIDANGCPEDVSSYLKSEIENYYAENSHKQLPPTNLTIVPEGGRSKAMNRVARRALEQEYDAVVYRNDDLIIPEGHLDRLVEGLNSERIVSSVAAPYDYISDTSKKPSLVQASEVHRRYREDGLENREFRGDFFAIQRETLQSLSNDGQRAGADGPFINVHSDDLYLDAWHQENFGTPLKSVSGCYSFYDPEPTWPRMIHRKTRQFEGPLQLAEIEPWGKHVSVIKGLERNVYKFMAAYSGARERAENSGLAEQSDACEHPDIKDLLSVWDSYLTFLKDNHEPLYLSLPSKEEVAQVLATLAPWDEAAEESHIKEDDKKIAFELVDKTIRLLAASKSEERSIVHNGSSWERDEQAETPRLGRLYVIGGISGSGKDTIIGKLLERGNTNLVRPVSYTTREADPLKEVNGVDYHFIKEDEFNSLIQSKALLEYDDWGCGNCYGTPRETVEQSLSAGKDVILQVSPNGLRQLKENLPSQYEVETIYIMPPSLSVIQQRLMDRNRGNPSEIATRMQGVKKGLEYSVNSGFTHMVVNDNLEDTVQAIQDFMETGNSPKKFLSAEEQQAKLQEILAENFSLGINTKRASKRLPSAHRPL